MAKFTRPIEGQTVYYHPGKERLPNQMWYAPGIITEVLGSGRHLNMVIFLSQLDLRKRCTAFKANVPHKSVAKEGQAYWDWMRTK